MEAVQTRKLRVDVRRIAEEDGRGQQPQQRTADHEAAREAEAELGQQPLQLPVRVDGLEPQVQWVAADLSASGRGGAVVGWRAFQQPDAAGLIQELLQRLGRQRAAEPRLGAVADFLRGGGAVELTGDEVFRLPEAEEAHIVRCADDVDGALARALPADAQIVTQPRIPAA